MSSTPLPLSKQRGFGLLQTAVGIHCPNQRDDVESVQRLLNFAVSTRDCPFALEGGALKTDGAFGRKTLAGIAAFQRATLGVAEPSGRIESHSVDLVRLAAFMPQHFSAELLALCYLRAGDDELRDFAPRLVEAMASRDIDTPLRRAHFIAQIGHESGELRFREEIASGAAYEGRKDLGNTETGDGRRFKGRGLIQLTGRANYAEYGRDIGRESELLATPHIIAEDAALCVDVAAWFWQKRKLNLYADADDLFGVTRRINGGLNGLDDRRRLLRRAVNVLPGA